MENKKDIFAENLNILLTDQGLTPKAFAAKVGKSEQAVGYWLRGEKKPNKMTLKDIADIFGLKPSELLGKSLRKRNDETINYDIGDAIRKIEASNGVILSAIGELLAKSNGMSVTVVQEQLETLVKKKLSSSEPLQ